MQSEFRDEDSDSENDQDYVPPADELSSDEERKSKKARVSSPSQSEAPVIDEESKKKAREALWAEFQASVSSPSSSTIQKPQPKMIKVIKKFRFAGEEVTEVITLSEDSEDAKKLPKWNPASTTDDTAAKKELQPSDSSSMTFFGIEVPASTTPGQKIETDSHSLTPGPSSFSAPQETEPKKPLKRPGPRKSKVIPLVPSSTKPKKLTTLDKSAMDWRSHVDNTNGETGGGVLKDELEANRRGGGYLEKVDFLKRVEERKEEVLDQNKSGKRRRNGT
ncbi:bucentaur or craniofacial development-domain-containing protein [Abortiporus biennis]|nr:bucentaur or craniofacial development-domain-containing protein [Abortiporus biennis]